MSILLLSFVFAGCQKQPTANFTTDKTSYVGGETIYCTNQSTDAYSYFWNISDGQYSSTENLIYNTAYSQSGTVTFELTTYSKNGNKHSTMIKTVTVTPAPGDATFWLMDGYITTVYLDGKSAQITSAYTDTPDCGTAGCANFNDLEPGTYAFYATDDVNEWNGNITIQAGQCSTMQLYLSKASPAKSLGSPKALK